MILTAGNPESVYMSHAKIKHARDTAAKWVEEGKLPALAVFAARRGTVVLQEAFGAAAYENDAPPLRLDTLFPLASISKAITATAAMILVEDGKLGLNRSVSYYIPEFVGEGKANVAVHHLLTHTSGMNGETIYAHSQKKKDGVIIPPPSPTQDPDLHEYLYLGYDAPLWKTPGTEMSYCGYGYELLGEIIRRVSGQSLDDFARIRIFEPLGMKDTHYVVPESLQHRVVQRNPDGPDRWAGTLQHMVEPSASSGAYSTAIDMAIFAQMYLNKGTYGDVRILSKASIETMTRNQIPGIPASWGDMFFTEASWGLGWSIQGNKRDEYGSLCSPQTFSHGGAGGTFLWVDPVREVVGVYFSVYSHYTDCGTDLYSNMIMSAIED
ncbi:serine hydrolase domain-containing protein [Paenibacillus sp. CAU 1782]